MFWSRLEIAQFIWKPFQSLQKWGGAKRIAPPPGRERQIQIFKICLYILFICSSQNRSTLDADIHQWVTKFVNMEKMAFFPGAIAPKLTWVPYLIFWYMMYFSKIFNISENEKNCYESRLRLNLLNGVHTFKLIFNWIMRIRSTQRHETIIRDVFEYR